jgi:hypothetical protein
MPKAPIRPPIIRETDDLFQREVRRSIKELDSPEQRRVTVKSIVLGATTVKVPHQLGKLPVGWQVADKNAQADIWRDITVPSTNDYIGLKASATVTVDLIFW